MNKDVELLSLYNHAEPYDKEHFILKTYEIYVSYDLEAHCTRITIKNVSSKHQYIIYIDYIQPSKNLLIEAAETMIKTNLLI